MNDENILNTRKIRKQILDCAYGRAPLNKSMGNDSMVCALIRQTLNLAARDGLSGEDTMTILAFNALLQLETLYNQELEKARLSIKPHFIFANGEVKS